jgi:hypothetical protein
MRIFYCGQFYTFTNEVEMLALIGWLKMRDQIAPNIRAAA